MSDEECGGIACTIKHSFFECGFIELNNLDIFTPIRVFGTEACPDLSPAEQSLDPDFDTCVTETCSARFFEEFIVQLEPLSGRAPFVWEHVSGDLPPNTKFEPNGRFRGPAVNFLGSWEFLVRLTDSDGRSVEKNVRFETGG